MLNTPGNRITDRGHAFWKRATFWTSLVGVSNALMALFTALAATQADSPKRMAITAAVGGVFGAISGLCGNIGSHLARSGGVEAAQVLSKQAHDKAVVAVEAVEATIGGKVAEEVTIQMEQQAYASGPQGGGAQLGPQLGPQSGER